RTSGSPCGTTSLTNFQNVPRPETPMPPRGWTASKIWAGACWPEWIDVRIPLSTYRLQFGRGFGFREARELLPYLKRLGITDIYASPIFQANSDTASGYDIVDPTRLSPALGTWDDFIALCT